MCLTFGLNVLGMVIGSQGDSRFEIENPSMSYWSKLICVGDMQGDLWLLKFSLCGFSSYLR